MDKTVAESEEQLERGAADGRGSFERGHRCSLLAGRNAASVGFEGQHYQAVGRAVGSGATDA